jgi:hypothetical protein
MAAQPGLRSAAACVPVVGALRRSRAAHPAGALGPGYSRPLGGPLPGRFARARDASAAGRSPHGGWRIKLRPIPSYLSEHLHSLKEKLGTPPCLQRATSADARVTSCDAHGHAQRSCPQCAWPASIVVIPKYSAKSDDSLAASTSLAAETTFST